MKKLILSCLVLTGCGSATLVSSRFDPVKSGTVRLDGEGAGGRAAAREDAKRVMFGFCHPQLPKIVGTDMASQPGYAVASPMMPGVVQYQQIDSPLVHFKCVDPAEISTLSGQN